MSTNNKLLVSDISFFEKCEMLAFRYYNLASCDIALDLNYSACVGAFERISLYIYSPLNGSTIGIDINKNDGRLVHVNSINITPEFINEEFRFPGIAIKAFPKIAKNRFEVDQKYKDIGIYDIYQECKLVIYNNAVSFIFNASSKSYFELMPTSEILFSVSAERELLSVTSLAADPKVWSHLL